MTRLRNLLALLRARLWILPAVITLAAGVLGWLLLSQGATLIDVRASRLWWLYSGDASTARDLLSSFLSGLMTMTSLIVSVTFVILTLAANQLGPRLIGIFLSDRQIQSVLGLFLGTILYVILVLRTLGDTLGDGGVPHLAVTVASVLTIACLFALIFYIHKVARSIIADNVVEGVARRIRQNRRGILRSEATGEEEVPAVTLPPCRTAIALRRGGYLQVVDYARLVELACRAEATLKVHVRAGHYLLEHGDHVVAHAGRPLEEKDAEAIRGAFIIGSERTPAQDLEYGLRQLVEIALRALSPGINDPFTAMAVIDRLGTAMEEIFAGTLQPGTLCDGEGQIRVLADRSDEAGLTGTAFDQIRQAGAAHPAILICLADTLGALAPVIRTSRARDAVLSQIEKLAEAARQAAFIARDATDTVARIDAARAAVFGGQGTTKA